MADLNGRLFERRGDSLVPADLAALEFVQGLPEGKKLLMDHRTPRHPENHAHFFALLNKACGQMDGYPDTETLLDAIKIAVKHTRPVQLPTGEIVDVPKSINFASMGEEEFKRFKNRALYVLGQALGYDPQILLDEVQRDERSYRR